MKIRSITYRENRASRENKFIHQHVELTADLTAKESPEKALEQLRAEVRKLLYPELIGLRERVRKISTVCATGFDGLTDEQLAELYSTHSQEFEEFLAGKVSVSAFLSYLSV